MDGSLSTTDQTLPILGPARPSPLEEGNKGTRTDPPLTYINGGALGPFLGLDKQIFSTARSKPSAVLFSNLLLTSLLLSVPHLLLHHLTKSPLHSQYRLDSQTHTQAHIHTSVHIHRESSASAQLESWRLQVFAQTILPCSMVPRWHAPFQQLLHHSTTL